MIVALGFNYVGAQSDINIWNPPGVQAGDYSSAQISLIGGISNSFESIEAGWMVHKYFSSLKVLHFSLVVNRKPVAIKPFQVNPSVFGDSRTRLFAYWTVSNIIT